jgi:hypothetical protein
MNSEHKYIFLEALYENKDEYWSLNEFWNNVSWAIGWDDYLKLVKEFQDREYVDPDEEDIKIQAIGINHYFDLKKQREEESKQDRKAVFDRKLKNGSIILMATLTVISVASSLFTYFKATGTRNLELNSFSKKVEQIEHKLDSLTFLEKAQQADSVVQE